jgi:hypothetical protein
VTVKVVDEFLQSVLQKKTQLCFFANFFFKVSNFILKKLEKVL